jgi:hypothetical protein
MTSPTTQHEILIQKLRGSNVHGDTEEPPIAIRRVESCRMAANWDKR